MSCLCPTSAPECKLHVDDSNVTSIVLFSIWLTFLGKIYLCYRQFRFLERTRIKPSEFTTVTESTFQTSRQFHMHRLRIIFILAILDFVINIRQIQYGYLYIYWNYACKWTMIGNEVFRGWLWHIVMHTIHTIITIPILAYDKFALYSKFNAKLETILNDIANDIAYFMVWEFLKLPLAFVVAYFMTNSEGLAFFSLWLITMSLIVFSDIAMHLLFRSNNETNRLNTELRHAVNQLLQQKNFPLDSFYMVPNWEYALVDGTIPTHRIVLSDNLVEKRAGNIEILAIVSHKLAHWVNNDVYKTYLLLGTNHVVKFYIFQMNFQNASLYRMYGFESTPVIVGYDLVTIHMLSFYNFVSTLAYNACRRSMEYQADNYAAETYGPTAAIKGALVENEVQHWCCASDKLFVTYYHQYPTMTERVRNITEFRKTAASQPGTSRVEKKPSVAKKPSVTRKLSVSKKLSLTKKPSRTKKSDSKPVQETVSILKMGTKKQEEPRSRQSTPEERPRSRQSTPERPRSRQSTPERPRSRQSTPERPSRPATPEDRLRRPTKETRPCRPCISDDKPPCRPTTPPKKKQCRPSTLRLTPPPENRPCKYPERCENRKPPKSPCCASKPAISRSTSPKHLRATYSSIHKKREEIQGSFKRRLDSLRNESSSSKTVSSDPTISNVPSRENQLKVVDLTISPMKPPSSCVREERRMVQGPHKCALCEKLNEGSTKQMKCPLCSRTEEKRTCAAGRNEEFRCGAMFEERYICRKESATVVSHLDNRDPFENFSCTHICSETEKKCEKIESTITVIHDELEELERLIVVITDCAKNIQRDESKESRKSKESIVEHDICQEFVCNARREHECHDSILREDDQKRYYEYDQPGEGDPDKTDEPKGDHDKPVKRIGGKPDSPKGDKESPKDESDEPKGDQERRKGDGDEPNVPEAKEKIPDEVVHRNATPAASQPSLPIEEIHPPSQQIWSPNYYCTWTQPYPNYCEYQYCFPYNYGYNHGYNYGCYYPYNQVCQIRAMAYYRPPIPGPSDYPVLTRMEEVQIQTTLPDDCFDCVGMELCSRCQQKETPEGADPEGRRVSTVEESDAARKRNPYHSRNNIKRSNKCKKSPPPKTENMTYSRHPVVRREGAEDIPSKRKYSARNLEKEPSHTQASQSSRSNASKKSKKSKCSKSKKCEKRKGKSSGSTIASRDSCYDRKKHEGRQKIPERKKRQKDLSDCTCDVPCYNDIDPRQDRRQDRTPPSYDDASCSYEKSPERRKRQEVWDCTCYDFHDTRQDRRRDRESNRASPPTPPKSPSRKEDTSCNCDTRPQSKTRFQE